MPPVIAQVLMAAAAVGHQLVSLPHLLGLCDTVAQQSPDSTKVGCVITSSDGDILVTACNDFVHGAAHTEERLQRPMKYSWIEHAERNAIYAAAANGIPLDGTTMFINWWPCIDCCRGIIQSGIRKIVSSKGPDFDCPRWGSQFRVVQEMLDESGIEYKLYENTKK